MNRIQLEIELVAQTKQMDALFQEAERIKGKIEEKDAYIQKLRGQLGMNVPLVWDEDTPAIVYSSMANGQPLGIANDGEELVSIVLENRETIFPIHDAVKEDDVSNRISLFIAEPVEDLTFESLKLQADVVKLVFPNCLKINGEPIKPIADALDAFNSTVVRSAKRCKPLELCGIGASISMRGGLASKIATALNKENRND